MRITTFLLAAASATVALATTSPSSPDQQQVRDPINHARDDQPVALFELDSSAAKKPALTAAPISNSTAPPALTEITSTSTRNATTGTALTSVSGTPIASASGTAPTNWSNSSVAPGTTVVYSTYTPSAPTSSPSATSAAAAGDHTALKKSMTGLVVFFLLGVVMF